MVQVRWHNAPRKEHWKRKYKKCPPPSSEHLLPALLMISLPAYLVITVQSKGRAIKVPESVYLMVRWCSGILSGLKYRRSLVNVNVVNVISRTALIRNRVSRRVFHVSKITWGVLYLFQEAQTHWLPVLGVPPRVVPYTWPILKCCAV